MSVEVGLRVSAHVVGCELSLGILQLGVCTSNVGQEQNSRGGPWGIKFGITAEMYQHFFL